MFFLLLRGFSNSGKGFYFGTKFDKFVCISLSFYFEGPNDKRSFPV